MTKSHGTIMGLFAFRMLAAGVTLLLVAGPMIASAQSPGTYRPRGPDGNRLRNRNRVQHRSTTRETVGGSTRGRFQRATPPRTRLLVNAFKLEVQRVKQQVIGDIAVNADWVSQMKTATPSKLRFRFTTLYAGSSSVEWQVAKFPFSKSDLSGQFANLKAKGYAGNVPPIGATLQFDIDFQNFLPAKPDNTTYYVRLVGRNAHGKYTGAVSLPVAITYERQKTTKFTAEGLGLTTKQKHADMYNHSPMPIAIDLKELYVGNENEGGDEPYLFVLVIYADGTTINPLSMASSTVRIDCPTKTHGNVPDEDVNGNDLDTARTAIIPAQTGHFERTIKPIGLELAADLEDCNGSLGQAMKDGTAVYILVVAMEEDNTSTSAIDAARAAALSAIQNKANGIIQQMTLQDLMTGKTPTFDPQQIQKELREKAMNAAKNATLSGPWFLPQVFPLILAQAADPDDYVGWSLKQFTFGDLLASGPQGINFEMSLANPGNWEGSYTVRGRIRRK